MRAFWLVLQLFAFLALGTFVLYAWLLVGLRIIAWWNSRHVRYGRCRVCGCTDDDCSSCVLATGESCWWVDESHTLCSRCVDHLAPAPACNATRSIAGRDCDDVFAGCSPLNARSGNADFGMRNGGMP
jgi:hypothetical protein